MSKKTEDGSSSQADKKHFVEDVGLAFEEEGLPRMAGRILGWLLVSEVPQVSLQELAEILHASKGSISTMSRLLMRMSVVERVSLPGERRDYIRLKPGSWSDWFAEETVKIGALRQLAEHGLELLESKSPVSRERLEEMRDLFAFLEQEYPILLERWEKKRRQGK
jgi:DNA-binding transcriptional regulator GbsR (MarR family)